MQISIGYVGDATASRIPHTLRSLFHRRWSLAFIQSGRTPLSKKRIKIHAIYKTVE